MTSATPTMFFASEAAPALPSFVQPSSEFTVDCKSLATKPIQGVVITSPVTGYTYFATVPETGKITMVRTLNPKLTPLHINPGRHGDDSLRPTVICLIYDEDAAQVRLFIADRPSMGSQINRFHESGQLVGHKFTFSCSGTGTDTRYTAVPIVGRAGQYSMEEIKGAIADYGATNLNNYFLYRDIFESRKGVPCKNWLTSRYPDSLGATLTAHVRGTDVTHDQQFVSLLTSLAEQCGFQASSVGIKIRELGIIVDSHTMFAVLTPMLLTHCRKNLEIGHDQLDDGTLRSLIEQFDFSGENAVHEFADYVLSGIRGNEFSNLGGFGPEDDEALNALEHF